MDVSAIVIQPALAEQHPHSKNRQIKSSRQNQSGLERSQELIRMETERTTDTENSTNTKVRYILSYFVKHERRIVL